MKMKKYMAMGLGAIMAVGIAVSGVLPVSAVNNNENDAKLATAVTMAARDYDDYEGVIKSSTTLRSKATSNSRKITTLKKGAVVEVERKASNGWYRVEYRDIEGYVSPKNIKVYDSEYRDVEKKGTVTSNVNMRLGASTLSKKVTYLKKGTVIKIESKTSNGWYKIEYKGRDGYISQKHAKIGTNTNKKDYTYREMDDYDGITTAKLTLRRSPSSSSAKITSIPKGARVEVEGKTSNGFYRVEYRDIEGYVSSKYIKLVRDYD